VSCVRACRLARFSRAAWYRRSRARDQSALRARIREIAHARPRFGCLRIWVLLRREGWGVNRKRVRRLYRLDGLQLRMRVRRRKHITLHRGPAPVPTGPTERWSMDFVHDALADGRSARRLGVSLRRTARLHPPGQTRRKRVHGIVQRAAPRRMFERTNSRRSPRPQAKIEAWRIDYNQRRPHGSLGHLTPTEFVAQCQVMTTAEAAPV
jgi:transposase InsO family protein